MIFNVLAIVAASAAAVFAAPPITYPRAGTVWTQGYAHNITWSAVSGTGSFALTSSGGSRTLASGVNLEDGHTVVTVPRVNGGPGYTIVLTADDGSSSSSGSFTMGAPDTPGSATGTGSVTVTTSTSTVASGSAASSASSAASSASSAASSASSAASSIASSASSALSSLSSAAASGASSISSRASSALSSATAPASGSGSASGSAASSSGSSSAALGLASYGDLKFGAAVTAGLLVVSTLGGLAIF